MITTQGSSPRNTTYNVQAQKSHSDKAADDIESRKKSPDSSAKDVVSISNDARKAIDNSITNSQDQYYEKFMPTYEGFSATNIAAGVSSPGSEPFSSGKTFEQVAIYARSSLDKNYEKLYNIGKPYVAGSATSTDKNSLLGELDRRALYAVVSNEGGLFTKYEQALAQSTMSQQQGLAMGLYAGPISESDKFIDPFFGDSAQQFKAGIQFLDQVSNEEKAGSIDFAIQRSSMQQAYELKMRDRGEIPEDFSTIHPLVNLILQALESRNGILNHESDGSIFSDSEDLRNQPWFSNYSDRLDEAINKTKDLYLG